jgi:ketosteroid isomerase-like protein
MAQEDVEGVSRSFNAWNEWDVDAIRRLCTGDVVVRDAENPLRKRAFA